MWTPTIAGLADPVMIYSLAWIIVGGILRFFARIKRYGLENVPRRGGLILAANHRSYWDPPIVSTSVYRPVYFLAKRELFDFPPLGWLFRKLHTIPMTRESPELGSYKAAINHLLSGQVLILFPEGTRSPSGQFLEPKLGVGRIALETSVPIVPVYLENSRPLWKALLGRNRLTVSFGQPLESQWLQNFPKNKAGYRQVAQELMDRIKKLKENKNSPGIRG